MNNDHLAGGLRHLKGRVQTAAGGITGDFGKQAEGAINQVAGGARYVYGDARDAYRDARATASGAYEEAQSRVRSTIDQGSQLADEAKRRSQDFRNKISSLSDGNRTIGLMVAAGVGFALASIVGRRSR